MISGYDENGNPGMVIIELKQWSKLEKVDKSDSLVETYTGMHLGRSFIHLIRHGHTLS